MMLIISHVFGNTAFIFFFLCALKCIKKLHSIKSTYIKTLLCSCFSLGLFSYIGYLSILISTYSHSGLDYVNSFHLLVLAYINMLVVDTLFKQKNK